MDRRRFLASVSCSLVSVTTAPLIPARGPLSSPPSSDLPCWLDVCAPFIVEDAERGIHSEIVLTSDTFVGPRGHEDGKDATDYEIHLFDAAGRTIGPDGVALKISAPAMRPAVIAVRELIGASGKFRGGANIRLRPNCRERMHASDLFSSAFVRWRTASSFDNVHANPDPLQWQNTESYFYSMPFPSLAEYDCLFSLFNPYGRRSAGEIVVYDPLGKRAASHRYDLNPRSSLFFDLNAGGFADDPGAASRSGKRIPKSHGMIAAINDKGASKSFGYLMIGRNSGERFTVEHPIHQGVFKSKPAAAPFDAGDQFKARNVLYSPLLFNGKRIGGREVGLTLESRFYLGSGLPLEEVQWFYPFAVDGGGNTVWSAMSDRKLPMALPRQTDRGVIRLTSGQSCALDFSDLSMEKGFAGGLAVAVTPDTSHTMIKVEVRAPEWGAHAFTHFRPGLRSARAYQKPSQRGGLVTDYIVSGASLVKSENSVKLDELAAVLNIDDQGIEARPVIELFGPKGFIAKVKLGALPPFACRHFLLSELISEETNYESLTLRLVDERAALLMSAIHIDYVRRDIALDHGSDRFSTFNDFGCQ
jgi:hypothetical protein